MNDWPQWRWFPYLGMRDISRAEAEEEYDIILPERAYIKAFVFAWLGGNILIVGKVKGIEEEKSE